MERLITFLKEVRVELSKVTWPTRQQTIQYTVVVLGLSLFVAVFLGGIDWVLQLAMNKLILK